MRLNSITVAAAVAFSLPPAYPQVSSPSFEVTSVKPRVAGQRGGEFGCANGRFVSRNLQLLQTLLWAYDLKPYQLVGVPDWLRSIDGIYDIEAKTSTPASEVPCKRMVQTLLADRFKMAVHREQRETAVYQLVPAKNGPKLQEVSESDATPGVNVKVNGTPLGVPAGAPKDLKRPSGWTMANLADFLAIAQLGRPVLDRTGLEGVYRISFDFSFSFPGNPQYVPPPEAGPDVFTALQTQLGLRLEPTKASVEIVVIDHLQKPQPN